MTIDELFQQEWDAAFDAAKERSPIYDPADYYSSGRASKAYPDKENPDWWLEKGPEFIRMWETWRDNCGLEIAELPDPAGTGELIPGIEYQADAHLPGAPGGDLYLVSAIDRVMVDPKGDLYIVDLKTGSSTDPWPLQLALNNLGLYYTTGQWAKWGGFWNPRKGGISGEWFDLSIYDEDWLWNLVWTAREIRDRQLFLPNPSNLCKSACGVAKFCKAMGGSPSLFLGPVQQ